MPHYLPGGADPWLLEGNGNRPINAWRVAISCLMAVILSAGEAPKDPLIPRQKRDERSPIPPNFVSQQTSELAAQSPHGHRENPSFSLVSLALRRSHALRGSFD